MSVISLAVINKNRQPIYMKEFSGGSSTTGTGSGSDDDLQLFGISSTSSSPTNVLDNKTTTLDSHVTRCDCSTRQQFIIYDALDYMEQWIESNSTSHPNSNATPQQQQQHQSAHDAMFAGLLCPIEDMRVYGKNVTFCIGLSFCSFERNESLKNTCDFAWHNRIHDHHTNHFFNCRPR